MDVEVEFGEGEGEGMMPIGGIVKKVEKDKQKKGIVK